ncbi:MAG: hypothetical protein NZ482_09240 [Gloeomargarita sp. SKYG98]|nr:hypothetical protein [Gloeomargarita sp. SKYG98]
MQEEEKLWQDFFRERYNIAESPHLDEHPFSGILGTGVAVIVCGTEITGAAVAEGSRIHESPPAQAGQYFGTQIPMSLYDKNAPSPNLE